MTLKSLDEFNSDQVSRYITNRSPSPNGIACPSCGKEMLDSRPDFVLTSNPPKKNVHCPACGYTGYRVA